MVGDVVVVSSLAVCAAGNDRSVEVSFSDSSVLVARRDVVVKLLPLPLPLPPIKVVLELPLLPALLTPLLPLPPLLPPLPPLPPEHVCPVLQQNPLAEHLLPEGQYVPSLQQSAVVGMHPMPHMVLPAAHDAEPLPFLQVLPMGQQPPGLHTLLMGQYVFVPSLQHWYITTSSVSSGPTRCGL